MILFILLSIIIKLRIIIIIFPTVYNALDRFFLSKFYDDRTSKIVRPVKFKLVEHVILTENACTIINVLPMKSRLETLCHVRNKVMFRNILALAVNKLLMIVSMHMNMDVGGGIFIVGKLLSL